MSTATMGDLDDISCKTCLQLKIVILKPSCCYTNSVKKKANKTKSSHSDYFCIKTVNMSVRRTYPISLY